MKSEDEVTVGIGRNGDILFTARAHRLSIARILDVGKIPVKISVIHPKWVDIRKELLMYARKNGGRMYQPAIHPLLKDIPSFHECEDRFLSIRENMSVKRGSLLDIGANLGYFCHKFEDEGFDCYAMENSPMEIYFLKKLKRAENKKFRIIAESVLDYSRVWNTKFDVTLGLNIFHHFLETKQLYDKFVSFLKHHQTKELFLEPHNPNEKQMRNAYRNYTPEEFVRFVLQISKLKKAKSIGVFKDGRQIYKLN